MENEVKQTERWAVVIDRTLYFRFHRYGIKNHKKEIGKTLGVWIPATEIYRNLSLWFSRRFQQLYSVLNQYTHNSLSRTYPTNFIFQSDQMIKEMEANSGVLKKKPPKPKTPPPPPPPKPSPPPEPPKKKEPSKKFVTLDKLMKEKFPMDPDPNAKPKPKPKPITPAPSPTKTDDATSSNNSYVGRHQQRSNYYAKKNKTPRTNLNGVQSDSPVSKTPANPASPIDNQNNPSKSVSPDRRRPKDNNRKDPKGSRPSENPEDNKLNKPKEHKNAQNKPAPNKTATNTQNKGKPTKHPPDVSPEKAEPQGIQQPESPAKKPQKDDRIDSRGYYKNFKAEQILNQTFEPPDILQINHDTDPVDDPPESPDPKGYQSIYQKRKHFNEFKTLPKQTV